MDSITYSGLGPSTSVINHEITSTVLPTGQSNEVPSQLRFPFPDNSNSYHTDMTQPGQESQKRNLHILRVISVSLSRTPLHSLKDQTFFLSSTEPLALPFPHPVLSHSVLLRSQGCHVRPLSFGVLLRLGFSSSLATFSRTARSVCCLHFPLISTLDSIAISEIVCALDTVSRDQRGDTDGKVFASQV